uniref:Sugar phosphate transporter domain-containing protein n=1 Tax=Anas platyrhynchos platyrhynchos TaxID=8840 RepID=A0A493STU9_ANAPP
MPAMSSGQSPGQAAEGAPAAAPAVSAVPRVLSALFYGTCSFLIVLVNKALLSAYRFPSPIFLGIGQVCSHIKHSTCTYYFVSSTVVNIEIYFRGEISLTVHCFFC